MSDLTVLMPTFNRARVLEQTLEAMCQVRRKGFDVEFVVVNNGSTDETSRVLNDFAGKLPLTTLWEPRAGKCNALNHALDRVELGDIVVFTDDDVTPDPEWLEVIVAACSRWPKYQVFGGRIVPGWPPGVPVPFWAADKTIQAVAFSAHHVSDQEGPYPDKFEPFGPNFWVRREALEGARFRADLGPHPTRRTLGDESEFLRQLRARGHSPLYVPSARVVHRIEPERTTPQALYRRAFQSGRGTVHVSGPPESQLLSSSVNRWRLRVASNVTVGALQLVGAALEPDEKLRFSKLYNRTFTFSKNLEALRCAVKPSFSSAQGTVFHGAPRAVASQRPRS